LIHLLEVEQDAGVIEQTSLALRMIKAVDAIPVSEVEDVFQFHANPVLALRCYCSSGFEDEVPFIAKHLYDMDVAADPLCAVRALATLTGEDFGLPQNGISDPPQAPVLKARSW
jgi:hypothetical protein